MKNTKKIALAAMSLVAAGVAAAGATGTFAWFSINTTVSVDGMVVTTTVDSNLLVGKVGEGTGTAGALTEGDLKAKASQARTGVLQPVSTVNASNFYYVDVTKVNGDGSSNPGTGVYTLWDGTSLINGVTSSKGYVAYDLVLKATATANHTLSLTKFNVTYTKTASEDGVVGAFRAALLASSAQTTLAAAEAAAPSLVTIMGSSTSEYYNVVSTKNQAVTSTSALGDVSSYAEAATIDDSLTNGDVNYYHVKVLFWLEGEDKACTNETFLELTGSWAVDINFAFEKAAEDPNPAVEAVDVITIANAA